MVRVGSRLDSITPNIKCSNYKGPPQTRKTTSTVYTSAAKVDRRYCRNKEAPEAVEGTRSKRKILREIVEEDVPQDYFPISAKQNEKTYSVVYSIHETSATC